MKNHTTGTRLLSFLLCVMLAVSLLPVNAMAIELDLDTIQNTVEAAGNAEAEESTLPTEAEILSEAETPEKSETLPETAPSVETGTLESGNALAILEIQSVSVNPLYQDILTEEDVLASISYSAPTLQSGATYTDIYSAAAYLRQQMVARTESIVIQYQAELTDFNAEAFALAEAIWEAALAHTGIPTEGDYLRGQLGGWNTTIDATYTDAAPTTYDMTITYAPAYFTTVAQEADVTARINTLMSGFAFSEDTSEYEKIRDIYAWICTAVAYDYAHFGEDVTTDSCGDYMPHSCYNALFEGTAVCQGYAVLFYRLALEAGLDARYVDGLATSGGLSVGHAWNIVSLDGTWYFLDVTWDEAQTADSYQWFLKGTGDFVDHYANAGQIESYSLSATSYEIPQEDNSPRTEGDYTYTVLAGEATITAYIGTDKDVVVPATLGGYPVVYVAREAFSNNDTMETLTFSEGIRTLAPLSVSNCSALREVYIPSSVSMYSDMGGVMGADGNTFLYWSFAVEKIEVSEENTNITSLDGVLYSKDMTNLLLYPAGKTQECFVVPETVLRLRDEAFEHNTYLKEIVLPEGLLIIGYWAFNHCDSLEKVNIPETCQIIGQYAFEYTKIQTLHIPASVSGIVSGAFFRALNLESITVDEDNPVYYAEDGILFCRENGTEYLICYPANKDSSSYTIPEGCVPALWSFHGAANLESIHFNNTITTIPFETFAGCINLKHVIVPDNVTTIEDRAFDDCTSLATIQIPASVTFIGASTFTNLESFVIFGEPGSYAEQYAQENGYTFCEIGTELEASGSCGEKATWSLKGNVLTIQGEGPMADYVWEWDMPWFLYRNVIEKVVIKDGITTIGAHAFPRCVNLKSVEIPQSVTNIMWGAFWNCTSLMNTRYYGAEAEWNRIYIEDNNECLFPIQFNARPGDITGDGSVGASDLVVLMKAITTDGDADILMHNVDLNSDGEVDILDVIRLVRYLAGEEVELY